MKSIFVDTSFIIALYNKDDEFHRDAVAIISKIKGCSFILTQAIILEIGNAFSSSKNKSAGVKIFDLISQPSMITLVTCENQNAYHLYSLFN